MKSFVFWNVLVLCNLLYFNCVSFKQDIIPEEGSSPLRLNKASLGRLSWKILHSFAAAYPQEPTENDKEALKALIHAFRVLYPCEECRGHFNLLIEANPVVTTNRYEVVMYFCKIHNIVNDRLRKQIFDCSTALNYWGGDCGCHGDSSSSESNEETTSSSNSIEESSSISLINETQNNNRPSRKRRSAVTIGGR